MLASGTWLMANPVPSTAKPAAGPGRSCPGRPRHRCRAEPARSGRCHRRRTAAELGAAPQASIGQPGSAATPSGMGTWPPRPVAVSTRALVGGTAIRGTRPALIVAACPAAGTLPGNSRRRMAGRGMSASSERLSWPTKTASAAPARPRATSNPRRRPARARPRSMRRSSGTARPSPTPRRSPAGGLAHPVAPMAAPERPRRPRRRRSGH